MTKYLLSLTFFSLMISWSTTRADSYLFPAAAPSLVVTSTGDNGGINPAVGAGTGTLRQAIVNANANSSATVAVPHIISFDLDATEQITLEATLPALNQPIIIDGTTATDWTSTNLITIIATGSAKVSNGSGFNLAANGCQIYGLEITGFNASNQSAILITGTQAQIGDVNKGNVISGNATAIRVNANNNTIKGNKIGTNAAGTAANANTGTLIVFSSGTSGNVLGGTTTGEGNLISGNLSSMLLDGNATLLGNYIGTDITGMSSIPNQGTSVFVRNGNGSTIGDGTLAGRNVISGNTSSAILVDANNVTIDGNYIGVNADATAKLANTGGIYLRGGTGASIGTEESEIGNVISGNNSYGLLIRTSGVTIVGNAIGTNPNGTLNLGNNGNGISVEGSNVHIGGSEVGAGNVIAYNPTGIYIISGSGNAVRSNSIFCNTTGLRIDTGANGNKVVPVFANITEGAGTGSISGTSESGDVVEVYVADDDCNSDQANTLLGSAIADTNGDWVLSGLNISAGAKISATATSTSNNTSRITFAKTEIDVYEGTDNTGTAIADAQSATVDLGSQALGTDLVTTFAIHNSGAIQLSVSSVTVSGTDYSVSITTNINTGNTDIAGGGTETFTLTLSGATSGTFEEIVTIVSNDANEGTYTFPVSGVITDPEIDILFDEETLEDAQTNHVDLGSAIVGSDLVSTFTIENTGNIALNVSSITVDNNSYTVGSAIAAIASDDDDTFTLTLSGATVGIYTATVTVVSDDVDESTFTFPITGAITTPEISVYAGDDDTGTALSFDQTEVLDMGTAVEGTDLIQTIAIVNTGSSVLSISDITVTGSDFGIENAPDEVGAGETETFEINLSGVIEGSYSASVTINSDDADEATFIFPVSAVITKPEIAVFEGDDSSGTEISDGNTSYALDFGTVIEGTDLSENITIANIGSSVLNVSSISVTGDFSVTSMISSVAVDGSATFTISLAGAAAGTYEETVTISSDDADEGTFTFPITAEITAPEINVYAGASTSGTALLDAQSAAFDVGTVVEGSDLTQTFAIENTGTSALTVSSVSVSGSDYVVTSAVSTVAVDEVVTFTVSLTGAAVGTYEETVTISSDDTDEGTFTFPITAEITAPEINVYAGASTSGTALLDAQSSAFDVGTVVEGSDLTQTFAIENTGTSALTVSSVSVSGSDYVVTSTVSTVAVDEVVTFTVSLTGAAAGTYEETVTISSDDADEGTFSFTIIAVVEELELPNLTLALTDKVYGDPVFELGANSDSEGVINYTSSNSDILSVIGTTATIKASGSVTITAMQEAFPPYTGAQVTADLVIDKAPLTIRANIVVVKVNSEIPELTMSLEGLVYDDTASDIELPTISSTAVVSASSAVYPIVLSGGSADNYEITLVNSSVVIKSNLDGTNVLGAEDSLNEELVFYPNPTHDQISLQTEKPFTGTIQVIDMSGRLYATHRWVETTDVNISLPHSSNLYLLKVEEDNNSVRFYKVLKQ
ncbi:choice-of-anchor D domain-containing protein [Reichenbachiella sp. MSK19-1]|uniref:Ig-like domain-containing protein n=1 Tax=Reichenbachiella sp. MSK19-1 TaxID=1897631 RepID=UPI000E6C2254|nr:choice-of-anchor D domain-containing protein [Reichenbachiella sp. MSK19-1]